MNKKNIAIIIAIIIVVAGGGGFYGGIKYQQSKKTAAGIGNFQNLTVEQRQQSRGTNGNRAGNGQAGGGFVNGQIIGKDSSSITVKDRSGGSKIVFYSGSTSIGKTATGTPDDLAVGTEVIVNGNTNSDGSLTAQNIQVRPNLPTPPPAQDQSGN